VRGQFLGAIRNASEPADVRRLGGRRRGSGAAVISAIQSFFKLNVLFQKESAMSPQRIAGIVLLVVGVIVLIVGMNASHSVADQVSNSFTGRFTKDTMWYLIGGGAAALFGLLLVLGGAGGKRA